MFRSISQCAFSTLSNRQKFNQIHPSVNIYEKLEKLGFGSLLKTKRFSKINKQKEAHQRKQEIYAPVHHQIEYNLPLLSFFAGAKVVTSIPPESLEEIAFVGRSNVGKSSLINSIAESTVVRTSDKPGLTQQLNFYNVGKLFHMVDMPGYGFAFADEKDRENWRHLMEEYITHRKTLKRVFVVLDSRHGVKVKDTEFLSMLDRNKVKFQIVLTKCDLLVLPNLAKRIVAVEKDIECYRNAIKDVIAVSSKTGAGINQFRKEILFLMGHLKPREFYESILRDKIEKQARIEKRMNKRHH
ncbi:P-loop containing nucleoside triphosphate hydrolase protein [Pilobolus umbonatus]|nr:P-loop containing nucleoside triphosphate hydrolase protein [Pilobolus umbonatus]